MVLRPGHEVSREALLTHFNGKVAKWWLLDDIVFTDALPVGGTGNIQKNKLRDQYRDYRLPGV